MDGYRVVCEDGITRHPDNFATIEAAEEFAEWGHACTNRHRIEWTGSEATGHATQDRTVTR